MPHAGLTRVAFPPERYADVERVLREQIVPAHDQLQNEGPLVEHLWLIDENQGEAIGIAIYPDDKTVEEVEGCKPHERPREIRVPDEAPNDYSRQRAQAVKDCGGAIKTSQWYTVIGRD